MRSTQEYKEISNEEGASLVSSEHESNASPGLKITTHAAHGIRYIPALLWALGCGFLAIGAVVLSARWSPPLEPQLVYCKSCKSGLITRTCPSSLAPGLILISCIAPAQEALRYHTSIYPDGFKEVTHFMGAPSPTIDNYWEQTYDLPSRIPKWQADKLGMPTMEIPGDDGHYVVLLDVFHSLHCLNEIRKSLHPEYYTPYHLRMNTTEEKAKMHLGKQNIQPLHVF
jgi:hypothetical protein